MPTAPASGCKIWLDQISGNAPAARPATSEDLLERIIASGVSGRVDRDASVIRGVKIIGTTSLNNREYDTGARAGEMLALRWDWLDRKTGDLSVPGTVRKAGKSMLYRLHPETLAVLRQIEQPSRELIFPLGCNIGTLYNRFKSVLKAAGLPADRRSKFHRLRRTFASHLEAVSPGAATDALAHSSRDVTRLYLDERITKRVQPVDLLPREWITVGGAK